MAEFEETPEEIHGQLIEERKSEKKKPSFLSALTTNQKMLVAIIIGAIFYTQYIKSEDSSNLMPMLAVAAILIYFITSGKETIPAELDEQQLKIELFRRLRYKQIHPLGNHFEIPMGDVCIDAPTKERWLESNPWKRVIGFYVKDRMTGLKDYWTATVDIRTGNIKDLKHKFFDGTEAPDLKWIKSPTVSEEERYQRTIGRRKKWQ